MKLTEILKETNVDVPKVEVGEQVAALKALFKNIDNLTIAAVKKAKPTLAKDIELVFNARPIRNFAGKTIDDLVYGLAKGTLSAKQVGDFAIGLMKTKGVSTNYIARLAPDFVQTTTFIQKYAKDGKPLTKASLKNSGYTDEAITEILKAAKSNKKFQSALKTTKTGTKTGAQTGTKTGTKTTATTGVKSTDDIVKQTTKTRFGGKIKQVADNVKNTKLGRGIIAAVKGSVRNAGLMKLLWWLLIGGVAYYVVKSMWDSLWSGEESDIPSEDDLLPINDWMECIVEPLADDDNAEILIDDNGVISVKYKIDEFGGKKTGGHVIFSSDYSVKSANGETGTWSCNQSGLLNEQGLTGIKVSDNAKQTTSDISTKELSRMFDEVEDNLNGDFFDSDATDLKDAYNLIKSLENRTYKNRPALKVFVSNYPKIKGKGLGEHIMELKGLDFEATELRDELLSLIGYTVTRSGGGEKGDSDTGGFQGDGNPKTGLSHITVSWNEKEGGSGSGKIKYVPCDSFPFKFGCISDKIKDVQRCAGKLKVDGYYGPKTDARLASVIVGYSKTITKSSYDKITKECKGDDEVIKLKAVDNDKKVEKVSKIDPKGIVPIALPTLDTAQMIKIHGVEKLEDQINKTVDGRLIKDIIDNQIKFRGGRFVLKLDEELTQKQLTIINYYMASKSYSLEKKKETLKKGKYVWKADNATARKIARKEQGIKKLKDNE